jgi:virginiamycin B lyase
MTQGGFVNLIRLFMDQKTFWPIRLFLLVLGVNFLLPGRSQAGFAPLVVRYPLPENVTHLDNLILGPGGAVWFSSYTDFSTLGRLVPNGEVVTYTLPSNGLAVGGITIGPDANLWFIATELRSSNRLIGRLNPDWSVDYFWGPSDDIHDRLTIVTGPDGNLWYTGAGLIGRMTTSGQVTEFPLPGEWVSSKGLTVNTDGNLWFTTGGCKIGRATLQGDITLYPIAPVCDLDEILPAGDGRLWVSMPAQDQIGRYDPLSGSFERFSAPVDSAPRNIAIGVDGMLWFLSYAGLGKVEPGGQVIIVLADVVDRPNPGDLAAAPDGSLWVAKTPENQIWRVFADPQRFFLPLVR